jgi:NAD(P)-dependent dehydrogenase (short-subunit alcohol dehydrogenase family)
MKLERRQVAVVTGAASGIGLATSEAFSRRGLSVVMADIEKPVLEAAAARVGASGSPVLPVRTDVSDADQIQALARRTLEEFGRVDVVHNNAGVDNDPAPMWEMDSLDWAWILGVNLWGVINGIRAFVPHLVAQGRGHVVNTASMAGLTGLPFLGPYTASKHAIVSISETLRSELDQRAPEVGVTVVCPSYVHTNIARASRNRPDALTPALQMNPGGLQRHLDTMETIAIEPPQVAGLIMEAIESNRLHLLTHEGSRARWRQYAERQLEEAGA